MPKIKTAKSIAKRVTFTGTKSKKKSKILRRHAGQDHFNARERGDTGTHKKRDQRVSKSDAKNIKRMLPYR